MNPQSSSQDLHPPTGARFVFARDDEARSPRYALTIYLADGRTIVTTLAWSEGRASLADQSADGDETLDWARDQALKLARVLKASGQARLARWRG
ncbi:MAG: hypothetical protein JKY37_30025 [Nannocystaceae bacterium]|nr:hypothetical protein [Nannocystaceae bacterium]